MSLTGAVLIFIFGPYRQTEVGPVGKEFSYIPQGHGINSCRVIYKYKYLCQCSLRLEVCPGDW